MRSGIVRFPILQNIFVLQDGSCSINHSKLNTLHPGLSCINYCYDTFLCVSLYPPNYLVTSRSLSSNIPTATIDETRQERVCRHICDWTGFVSLELPRRIGGCAGIRATDRHMQPQTTGQRLLRPQQRSLGPEELRPSYSLYATGSLSGQITR